MGSIIVFGTYTSREQLEGAIGIARAAGFRIADVSVLVPESFGASELEEIQPSPESGIRLGPDVVISSGGLGSLGSAGTLIVPGMGPMLAAGPLLTALSRAHSERSVASITVWLIGVGVSGYQARHYQRLLQRGCILASLHADNAAWVSRAKRIFEGTGAQNVFEANEAQGAFAQADKPKLRKAS